MNEDDVLSVARKLEARGYMPIVRNIASKCGLSTYAVIGRGRTARVMRARHELYFELRKRALSLPEIGALLNRDHTTILAGLRRFEKLLAEETEKEFILDEPEVRVRIAV